MTLNSTWEVDHSELGIGGREEGIGDREKEMGIVRIFYL
jgi:hypothetical protein